MYARGVIRSSQPFGAFVHDPTLGLLDLSNPSDLARYNQKIAGQGAALQASINSGNVNAAATLAQPDGARTLANQLATHENEANLLTNSAVAVNQGQALINQATGSALIPTQALENQAQAQIAENQAVQQAADTYQQVQGGGVSAQAYTALPYVLGGAVLIGVIAWIAYSSGKHKLPTSSRRR